MFRVKRIQRLKRPKQGDGDMATKEKESDIFIGMKSIRQAVGDVSEVTVLKWQRESSLPIKKPSGVWIGSKANIERWWKEEFAN